MEPFYSNKICERARTVQRDTPTCTPGTRVPGYPGTRGPRVPVFAGEKKLKRQSDSIPTETAY
eukprot:2136648-Rhodomonas_salina.1